MKLLKPSLAFIILLSIGFADHRNKRHHKKHKKHRIYTMHYPRWTFGVNWHNSWNHCTPNRKVVVVKNESENDKHESVLNIIEEIEKLAELKEKGLITQKEYEKKKKDLLKRI